MKKYIGKFITVLLAALLVSAAAAAPAYAIHDPQVGDTLIPDASFSDQYLNTINPGNNYALCAGLSETALEGCILAAQQVASQEEAAPAIISETTTPETTTPADTSGGKVLGVSKVRVEAAAPTVPTQQEQPEIAPEKSQNDEYKIALENQIDNLNLRISVLNNSLDKSNNTAKTCLLLIIMAFGFSVGTFFIGWHVRKTYYKEQKKRTVIKTVKTVLRSGKKSG
jgi:hypothetical protein